MGDTDQPVEHGLSGETTDGTKIIVYTETAAIALLKEGKAVFVRGIGNSMTPKLQSGDVVLVDPITKDTVIEKGDVVLCKVRGRVYMHKVTAVKPPLYQISNNHGHVNGWTRQIYGIMVSKVEI